MKGAVYSFIIVQVALNIKKILKKNCAGLPTEKRCCTWLCRLKLCQPVFQAVPYCPVFSCGTGRSGQKKAWLVKKDESWGETEKKLWKAQEKKFKKGIAGDENFL